MINLALNLDDADAIVAERGIVGAGRVVLHSTDGPQVSLTFTNPDSATRLAAQLRDAAVRLELEQHREQQP